MPVNQGKDSSGSYYRWGESGKKYYYKPKDKMSREEAKSKAKEQGQAIKAQENNSIIEMNNYIEICEMNPDDITGRSKIKLVFHEIYDNIEQYNKNGISWNETYTNDNKESAIGMPLVVQFLDDSKEIPVGHGILEVDENGEIKFKDSEVVGTIEDAYVADISIDGTVKKVFLGEGYIYNQRYPAFVKWLKDNADITKIKGSIEIGKKSPNESIIYEDGYKEKGRVPKIYDYTGHAILYLEEPADDSAILLEINNKNSQIGGTNLVAKKVIKGQTFEMNALNYYDICSIITKAFNKLMNPTCSDWCYDFGIYKFYPIESFVIFEHYGFSGEYWKVPYTITNGQITLGDVTEVEEDWKPANEIEAEPIDLSSLKEDFSSKNKKELNDSKGGNINMEENEKKIQELNTKIEELSSKVEELNTAIVEANKVIENKTTEVNSMTEELNSLREDKAKNDAKEKQTEVNAYFETEVKKNGFTDVELNSLKENYVDKCDLAGLKLAESELCVKKIKEINSINKSTELNSNNSNDLYMSIHNDDKSHEDFSDLY